MPVTAAEWPAFETLFCCSPSQEACWCVWPFRAQGNYAHGDPDNREFMRAFVEQGDVPGLLARLGSDPVGWCALGPLRRYPQYGGIDHEEAWAAPCVYVARSGRGRGVGRSLVASAKRYASGRGAAVLYGPPPWWIAGGPAEVAGAVATFLANGFEEIDPGARMPVLRCDLRATPDIP